jgi:hypothetical protein
VSTNVRPRTRVMGRGRLGTPEVPSRRSVVMQYPEEAARMGRAGRKLAEDRHALDRYVERVAGIVRRSG